MRRRLRNTVLVPLLLPCALALAGCGGPGASLPDDPLPRSAPVGTLGANNIALQVTATGGSVTLPCGQSAQITQPIALDATGHFDVAGTLTAFQAAVIPPVRPVPARFVGTTDGRTMTLTVTPALLGAPATGTYTLTYGAPMVTDIGACPG